MAAAFSLARAGRWLLDSGIQESSGGVARFYRAELSRNKPISTEITGYTASALIYLHKLTGDEEYLCRARRTAKFLVEEAWDEQLGTFPFERPSPSAESHHQAWFFDCGIIIRGLVAVWRRTHEDRLMDVARTAAHRSIADFRAGAEYHPILNLPGKSPARRTTQWSRGPGCYQLKAAAAWWSVAEATGDRELRDAYLEALDCALETHAEFLPGDTDSHRIMDRLHPQAYFLEGMAPVLERPDCAAAYAHGLRKMAGLLREIAPSFVRSDVYAQLLRARIYAADIAPLDETAAQEEADALAGFQAVSDDPRIDGGFFFGRRNGEMSPHVNPVSTVFALQALEMWQAFRAGIRRPCRQMLI